MSQTTAPSRNHVQHNHDVLHQVRMMPQHLADDEAAHHASEQRRVYQTRAANPRSTVKAQPYSKRRQIEAQKAATKVKGNPSALFLLPESDQFQRTPYDAMHLELEGLVKSLIQKNLFIGTRVGNVGTGNENPAQRRGKGLELGGENEDEEEGDGSDGEGSVGAESELLTEVDGRAAIASRTDLLDNRPITKGERENILRLIKTYKHNPRSTRLRRMRPEDILFMQQVIGRTRTPTSVQRLRSSFGTPGGGNPTANDWRVFATVFGPLCMPLLFHTQGVVTKEVGNSRLNREELGVVMDLFEIVSTSTRSSMSNSNIDLLEKNIKAWQAKVFALHPSLHWSTNFHAVIHIPENIRCFGPVYNYWCFPSERINFMAKSKNRSGGSGHQSEVVMMRAMVRAREVETVRRFQLNVKEEGLDEGEISLRKEAKTLFEADRGDTAAETLEHILAGYSNMDVEFEDGTYVDKRGGIPMKMRGKGFEGSLSSLLQDLLESYYRRFRIKFRTTRLPAGSTKDIPYLTPQVIYWTGIQVGSNTLDAAENPRKLIEKQLSSLKVEDLVTGGDRSNSLWEWRDQATRHGTKDKRAQSGLMCLIFEHTLITKGGEKTKRLFGVSRPLCPFEGGDVYGYRKK